MSFDLTQVKQQIIRTGQRLSQQGWAPATSGNYSHRLDHQQIAITVSGHHKGFLTPEQIMRVDHQATPLEDKRPSAETLLHCQLYELLPAVNAVLHTHSVSSTVLSLQSADTITFSGYELLKAFPGIATHEASLTLPVFDNTQDMTQLTPKVTQYLTQHPQTPAYLIRGHGMYAWGRDMAEAERVIEATEFLMACELSRRQIETTKQSFENITQG